MKVFWSDILGVIQFLPYTLYCRKLVCEQGHVLKVISSNEIVNMNEYLEAIYCINGKCVGPKVHCLDSASHGLVGTRISLSIWPIWDS